MIIKAIHLNEILHRYVKISYTICSIYLGIYLELGVLATAHMYTISNTSTESPRQRNWQQTTVQFHLIYRHSCFPCVCAIRSTVDSSVKSCALHSNRTGFAECPDWRCAKDVEIVDECFVPEPSILNAVLTAVCNRFNINNLFSTQAHLFHPRFGLTQTQSIFLSI